MLSRLDRERASMGRASGALAAAARHLRVAGMYDLAGEVGGHATRVGEAHRALVAQAADARAAAWLARVAVPMSGGFS